MSGIGSTVPQDCLSGRVGAAGLAGEFLLASWFLRAPFGALEEMGDEPRGRRCCPEPVSASRPAPQFPSTFQFLQALLAVP